MATGSSRLSPVADSQDTWNTSDRLWEPQCSHLYNGKLKGVTFKVHFKSSVSGFSRILPLVLEPVLSQILPLEPAIGTWY